jgi:hypothetical protein
VPLQYSQFIWGFEVFDSGTYKNNRIAFVRNGTTYDGDASNPAAKMNAGIYTADELAIEVARAMNAAASSADISCSFCSPIRRESSRSRSRLQGISISCSGPGLLPLRTPMFSSASLPRIAPAAATTATRSRAIAPSAVSRSSTPVPARTTASRSAESLTAARRRRTTATARTQPPRFEPASIRQMSLPPRSSARCGSGRARPTSSARSATER